MPQLQYFGHDAFMLEGAGARLLFDPFFSGNPLARVRPEEIKADYILLTHGHGDHLGDGIEIARANQAMIITTNEMAVACEKKGCRAHPMHIGGAFQFPFGRVKLTIAHHGSAVDWGGPALTYMGHPCGFLVTIEGKTLYHAGDTGLFLDMQLIGAMNHIDVALLPIGDNFTMGIDDAVKAAEFLKPALTVPMHFNTFDLIQADPHEFARKAAAQDLAVRVMAVGERIAF